MKLYTKIINSIKEDIANGVYQPGEKIPAEPELMQKYGVGRSTIREAIKTLAISGILKVKQGSGTTVTSNYQVGDKLFGNTLTALVIPGTKYGTTLATG